MASSKQAEKEHDNYSRYTRLLQDVAPKVLRKLFETRALSLKQVPSVDCFLADSNISNTLQQYLVKIRVLRQHQLDLLYPPDGSAVKMEEWDITLLCTVLKNTCNLAPQELANVEKIRNIRNTTSGHKPGASLSNQEFTKCWSDLNTVIDDVSKAINDQAFHEDLINLVSFIYHDKDTDLLESIVATWLKDEENFVETQACRNIQLRLENTAIITIGGISGSGKSGIAHHIALRLSKQGYTIYPVHRAEEIEKYANIKERQVFVMDDPVGKHDVDLNELRQFEKIHQNILSLTKGEIKLILTCRKNILNDEQFNSYETVVGREIVDLSSEENRLIEQEKTRMFDMYASKAKLSTAEKETILRETHTRFPLLCKVFGANLDKFERQAAHFFSEPFSVLLEEVKTIKQRDKYHYCALLLCLISQNSFDIDRLNVVSENSKQNLMDIMHMCGLSSADPMIKIEFAFKSLVGIYFIQEDTRFRFMHDSLFDVVAYQFGTDYPCEMLKYCSSSFIREYVRTEGVSTGDEHAVLIRQKHYTELTKRLYSDLNNGDFHDVFLNPSLRDQCFVKTFCSYTRTMKRDDLVRVYFKTCSNIEGYKSVSVASKPRWHKDWFIKLFLDEINARAIHWVMAYNHFEIFCACHSVAKTFKIRLDSIKPFNKFKSLFGKKDDQQRQDEETMILMVCLSGSVKMFNTVLQDNTHVDLTAVLDWYELNAMHMATISGNIELMEVLIKKGIDINSRDCRDVTPLFISAAMGHSNICAAILQQRVNVNEGSRNGSSPLFIAAQEGHTETVAVLLNHGANVNMCKRNGSSPLLEASGKGHVKTVSLLLEQAADVNQTNDHGSFPLYEAAKEGHTEVVRLLLQKDAVVNKTTDSGTSPLYEATNQGHTDIVRLLLQHETDEDQLISLLNVTAQQGNADILALLLQHGARLSCCHNKGLSPLYAAASGGHTESVAVLLKYGENADLCHSNGFTSLHVAALKGNTQTVSILLQNGADVNRLTKYCFSPNMLQTIKIVVENVRPQSIHCSSNDGVPPLYLAVLMGNAETANVLLQNEADADWSNNEGESFLYIAAREGYTDTVTVLLQHGSDINLCQCNGFSPLYIAAMKGRTETVDILLQHGANINLCDNDGDSPLHVAAMNGHTTTVYVLLKHKAEANLCTDGGFSPLYAAACRGNTRTVSMLLQYGAEINLGTSGGDTPLYRAAQEGKMETVSVLLQCKADVNQRSTTGCTPLIAAARTGHLDVIEALLSSGADLNIKAIDTGQTALMEAERAGHLDVVKALRDHLGNR